MNEVDHSMNPRFERAENIYTSDGLRQCLNVGRCRDEEKTSEDECTIVYCIYGRIQCTVFSSNKAMSRLHKLNTWRQTVRSAVETPIANQ